MATPALLAEHALVQLKDAESPSGHRPVRVIAWDAHGDALILGDEHTLIKAKDHKDFLSVAVRRYRAEDERYITAAPGWTAQIDDPSDELQARIEPIAAWHVLGPMDIRPIVARRDLGDDYTQRLYDPIAAHEQVKITPPSA